MDDAPATNGSRVLRIIAGTQKAAVSVSSDASLGETDTRGPLSLLSLVRPSDFKVLKSTLISGNPQEIANQRTAKNILAVLSKIDRWSNFTFDEFVKLSGPRKVPDSERADLEQLFRAGILGKCNNTYLVGPAFAWYVSSNLPKSLAA